MKTVKVVAAHSLGAMKTVEVVAPHLSAIMTTVEVVAPHKNNSTAAKHVLPKIKKANIPQPSINKGKYNYFTNKNMVTKQYMPDPPFLWSWGASCGAATLLMHMAQKQTRSKRTTK